MTLGTHVLSWRQTGKQTLRLAEGAATAVQTMHEESCFTNRVNLDPKSTSICFGVRADPPAVPCRDGVLVDNGAAAPKSCLPPLETRSPKVAGALLPTGEASVTTRTTYNQPPLRLYSTEEMNSKTTNLITPILSFSYDSSFFWKNNMSTAPSCRRVIETKSGQNVMFNSQTVLKVVSAPARFRDRGARCFVVRFLYVLGQLRAICSVFCGWKEVRGISFPGARYKQLDRCFSTAADSKRSCRRGRLEVIEC